MALLRDPREQGVLKPTLGLFTAITLIVGSMIGSGIFALPAAMMGLLQNAWLLVLVWIVGGIITICGALVLAELAGMIPRAGGTYQFIKEGMGRHFGFLYGWTFFWVVQTGIIAAVAVAFGNFTRRLFGFDFIWVPAVAVGCIIFLSVVNYLGAKFGGRVQDIFTVAKVIALLALVLLGFLIGRPTHATFGAEVQGAPSGFELLSAFFSAMLLGLFAMDGWPQAAYVAPEIKNPTRTVPRALLLGVASVIVVYVLATLAYVYLLPVERILEINNSRGVLVIASEAAAVFSGETGARLISAAVMVSTFGTVNAFILTSPRIFYAVAEDGMFPKAFRRLNPKTNVPTFAIAVIGTWSGLLVCLSRFSLDAYSALVGAVTFCIFLFYLPMVASYFILRRTRPNAARPYRTHFHPVVPIIFTVGAIIVVVNGLTVDIMTVINAMRGTNPLTSTEVAGLTGLWGTVMTLAGVPVLLYWRARGARGEKTPLRGEPFARPLPES
ncbi:MAG TPA: amino acid permease [Candidatus Thermoplasmatota archaeon]